MSHHPGLFHDCPELIHVEGALPNSQWLNLETRLIHQSQPDRVQSPSLGPLFPSTENAREKSLYTVKTPFAQQTFFQIASFGQSRDGCWNPYKEETGSTVSSLAEKLDK